MDPDAKRGITFLHHHVSFTLIIIIILIAAILLLIRPALTGYNLDKEFGKLGTSAADILKQIESAKSENLIVSTNLENCKSLNEDYLKQVTEEKNNTYMRIEEQRKLQSEFDQMKDKCEFDISQLEAEYEQNKSDAVIELNQMKIQFDSLQSSYDSIVQTSANNICCKNKVDTPQIDSYSLAQGRIVCTVDGKDKIECS